MVDVKAERRRASSSHRCPGVNLTNDPCLTPFPRLLLSTSSKSRFTVSAHRSAGTCFSSLIFVTDPSILISAGP